MLLSVEHNVNEFDIQMPHTCIIDTHVMHINRIHSAVGGFGPRTYHEPINCLQDMHWVIGSICASLHKMQNQLLTSSLMHLFLHLFDCFGRLLREGLVLVFFCVAAASSFAL